MFLVLTLHTFLIVQGDSGGPLMALNSGVWELYGTTSFTDILCWAGQPAGFGDVYGMFFMTRVTPYV